jgi:EmrB/QacA subfamily drug resistance transporter
MATTTQAIPSAKRIDYAATLDARSKAVILVGVLLGLLLAALDQTIVSTAMPRIVSELQGIELLAWVTTSYLLASTTMVPIYGKLSDLYGRKAILLFGIVVFLVGSALCGIAPTMLTLVIFRGIQGLGAAALTSTAFAVPADLFVPAERPRYQGIFMAVFGLASVIGPYVGGLLTDSVGWRWVFYVNLPLGLLALGFIAAKMPKMDSGIRLPIDYRGALALVLAVVPLLLALTLDKATFGWTSPLILGLFGLSIAGLVLFILAEMRAAGPIIPLKLFRIRTFTLVNLVSPMVGASMFAAILFMSLYLVNVLGVSSTQAGSTLIPLMGGMVVSSIVSSQIVQRLGRYKFMILGGLVLVAAAFWWLTTLNIDSTIGEVRWRMVLLGVGLGPAMPTLTLALQNAVPFEVVGTATASRQFFQQLGQVISSAIFGAILTTTLTASLTANLAPVTAKLPPELAAQFDVSRLRNGVAAPEGASGEHISIAERIDQSIAAQFDEQRALLTKAIRDDDAAAKQALLANPQTPPQLREALGAGIPAAARESALAQALAGLDQAESAALAQGAEIGREVDGAVKNAFTDSVTQIYWYAIPLVLVAFVLALFIPELPLRKTNNVPVVAME